MSGLFTELRQRNVFRVAAAYLTVAWLLLQIIETVDGLLTLPEWMGLYSLVCLAIGFPIAVFLAWAYELTPEGIRAADDTDLVAPVARFGGRRIDFVIIGALSSVIVLLLVKDTLIPSSPQVGDEIPTVSNFKQLTTSQVIFPPWASPFPLVADSSRLYFNTFESGVLHVKQLARAGGDPVPFGDLTVESNMFLRPHAMTPDQSGLLMTSVRSVEPEQFETTIFPVVGGPSRKLGDGINASYSSDGTRIAYMGAENQLFIANSDMSKPRKLLTAPGHVHWVDFFPDDRRLRYSVFGDARQIWEVSVDGSDAHPILPEWENIEHCCGTWIDDGKYYVFQAKQGSSTQLWAIREDGGSEYDPVQITNSALDFRRPTVVNDTKTMYAIGWQLRGEIVRYDSTVGRFLQLKGFESVSAELFSYAREAPTVAYVDYPAANLWHSNSDGSDRRQLTSPPMKVLYPVIAPDGRHIAFEGVLPDGTEQIYIISTDGGPYRPLTPANAYEESPSWYADSSKVAFSADGDSYIQSYDVASGTVEPMRDTEGLWGPAWSPDGNWLAANEESSGELVLLEIESGQRKEVDDEELTRRWYWWGADSEHMFFVDDERVRHGERFVRKMRVPDGEVEIVAEYSQTRGTWGLWGIWVGIDPDGAPLMLRDLSIHHIYELDWLQ